MEIDSVVEDVLKKEGKTLIFVLGEGARSRIERGFTSRDSCVATIERSRRDVKILFLNKLQYLLMFLMKLEAERTVEYANVVLYGLDALVVPGNSTTEQVRLSNLVISTLYKVRQKHDLKYTPIVWYGSPEDAKMLNRIVTYWDSLLQ